MVREEFNLIDTGGIDLGDGPFLDQIKIQAKLRNGRSRCYYLYTE